MSHRSIDGQSHHRETVLAESDNVAVHQCSCGMMHLQIGAVCLTMQPDELSEIGTVVTRALREQRPMHLAPKLLN